MEQSTPLYIHMSAFWHQKLSHMWQLSCSELLVLITRSHRVKSSQTSRSCTIHRGKGSIVHPVDQQSIEIHTLLDIEAS
jgi:hypothetical protein